MVDQVARGYPVPAAATPDEHTHAPTRPNVIPGTGPAEEAGGPPPAAPERSNPSQIFP